MSSTIVKRQTQNKQKLLKQFSKIPIVQISCEKVGVSRSTYYRWRQEDKKFAKNSDIALREGNELINDMAESQLLSLIKDKHPTGIIFWLKHRHPAYTARMEITASNTKDALSEQEFDDLAKLLYNKETFRKGQELLTSYVFRGLVSEKFAQLILRMFISQMRAEDILSKKTEADLMAEVMLRKENKKNK